MTCELRLKPHKNSKFLTVIYLADSRAILGEDGKTHSGTDDFDRDIRPFSLMRQTVGNWRTEDQQAGDAISRVRNAESRMDYQGRGRGSR